jgi:putative glycosyl hydrolase
MFPLSRRLAVACCALAVVLAVPAASHADPLIGIGDQRATMFTNPLFQRLDIPIVRYIAPYDAIDQGPDARNADAFITAAQATGAKVLVAFYHSRVNPEELPSVAEYTAAVQKFVQTFPSVREYQPWNEANRGDVPGQFSSPTARQAAQYYSALRKVCTSCTVTGLDLLDGIDMKPSLRYLKQFQKVARPAPKVWGLHNYSDTNRNSTTRTKQFLRAVKGSVWLTETGGIVKLGSTLKGGSAGQARAAKALKLTFKIADSSSRIKRLYVFQWTGSGSGARFDAGLTNPNGTARPAYKVFASHTGG